MSQNLSSAAVVIGGLRFNGGQKVSLLRGLDQLFSLPILRKNVVAISIAICYIIDGNTCYFSGKCC